MTLLQLKGSATTVEPIESLEKNKMLKLAADIRLKTYGMCRVGVGPWGFGMCNQNPSRIGLVINLSPNPYGDKPVSPEVTECTVKVLGFLKGSKPFLSPEEAETQSGSDPATLVVARALKEFSLSPIVVSTKECDAAFGELLKRDMNGGDRLTEDEAIQIASIRWYEAKTPREIVDFQLFEPLLCMPFAQFHKAVEAALGRPVWTHEFAYTRLMEEYKAMSRQEQGLQEQGMEQSMMF